MYVLGVVVRNVRIVESFERNKAKEARREENRTRSRLRGRRRSRGDKDHCSQPAPDEPPNKPG
jgi:hypothetical protein